MQKKSCEKDRCVNIRRYKADNYLKHQNEWQQRLETFMDKFYKRQARLKQRTHFNRRSLERVVSYSSLLQVLNEGEVIDCHSKFGEERLIVMSYVKTAPKVYRPLHVVIAPDENNWVIVTAYSPDSQPWKWTETLDERVCFCGKTQKGEY